MNKIYAVVVTYNRVEKLKKCLSCLRNQSIPLSNILIINNASTDETIMHLTELSMQDTCIRFKTLPENTGGAGGFYEGLKWAYDDGADWIWGMDDDAFAEEDALKNLLLAKKRLGEQNAYWSNCNKDKEFSEEYKKVSDWMFVGFFLSRKIIGEIGFPRKDFFIYFDDAEYAHRIINMGINIYKVRDSLIEHEDAIPNSKCLRLGKKEIEIVLLPKVSWKTYYFIRNRILMDENDKRKRRKAIKRGIRNVFKALLWDRKNFSYVLMGLFHGIKGKSGKVITP